MITTVRREAFGGLRLFEQGVVDDAGAQDGLNFEAPGRGPLRRRGGRSPHSATLMNDTITRIGYSDAGSGHCIAVCADEFAAYDSAGTQTAAATVTSGERGSIAHLGDPSNNRSFVANGEAVREWNGSAFSTPTVTMYGGASSQAFPKGRVLAVTPWDNRLIVAGFNDNTSGPAGGASDASQLFFSEKGDPLTYSDLWYEYLTPGDGEEITAAVTWLDRVLVFKNRKFFTFYSTSGLGAGNPTLDYTPIDENLGAMGVGCACAGPDGVYFLDRRGIYRTDGAQIVPVSSELDPLFGVGIAEYYTGPYPDLSALDECDMAFVGDELFVTMPTTSSRMVLKMDVRYGGWTVWDMPCEAVGATRFGSVEATMVGIGDELNQQGRAYGDDDGTNIDAFWTGPWETYTDGGDVTIRSTRCYGDGNFAVAIGSDYRAPVGVGQIELSTASDLWADGTDAGDVWADGLDPSDVWVSGAQFDDGWARAGHRGRVLCTRISNLDGNDMTVLWLEHHLTDMTHAVADSKGIGD